MKKGVKNVAARSHGIISVLTMICIASLCAASLFSQEPNAKIKKVHLIFKTHLDIGFTDLSSKVERKYIDEFIPNTLKIIEQLKTEQAEERYVWSTGSWLVWEYLQQASPEDLKKFEAAILRGDIVWNGVPYTTESEMMSRDLFAACLKRAEQLDRRFGKKTIAAKMTDVPGHTRSIVSPLFDAGIRMLHIGINSSSALPVVPPVSRWRNTDGKEIILVVQGDYGADMILPDGETVVSVNFTGDNHGPHSIEGIRQIYAAAKTAYPNARVAATSLNEVAADLLTMVNRIPVITSEIGDTWIYGMGSSPLRIARYRALSRLYSQWLQTGKIDANSPSTVDFAVKSGLVAEHTWGLDVKTHLKNWDRYDVDAFNAARNTQPFRFIEQSWAEVDENVDKAVAFLPAALQAEARKVLEEIEKPTPLTVTGNDRDSRLNGNGALTVTAGGTEVMMGELAYMAFSFEDYANYRNNYSRHQSSWVLGDFGKPGLDSSKAKNAQTLASVKNSRVTKSNDRTIIQCGLQFPENPDIDSRVFPESVTVEYGIPATGDKLDMKVTFVNKPAVRLPEAYMLSFVPSAIQRILAEKTGFMVDVSDVVPGGNRQMHAIDNFIDIITDRGTVRITSPDAPLVVIGERNMLNYSLMLPDLSKGVHFCLINNLWGTNFNMWWEGSISFRFTVEVIQYP